MTKSQTLALEMSEKRQKINELLAIESDKLSDEQRTEIGTLTKRLQEIEVETRAAIVAEGDDEKRIAEEFRDPKARELAELESRASIGAIFGAALEHRQTDGAEAELQKHLKLTANQIPLALIRASAEIRAVTPAPDTVGAEQAPIVPGVFPMSCAAFLGVDMPTVPVGDAVFPVLTQKRDSCCRTGKRPDAGNNRIIQRRRAIAWTPASVILLQPRRSRALRWHGRIASHELERCAFRCSGP